MTDIVLGSWSPDKPPLENPDGLTECLNVVPDTGCYRSFPSTSTYSSAMYDRPRGAWSGYSNNTAKKVFVGTLSKLYDVSSSTPTDVSLANYNCQDPDWWEFVRYGDLLYATNGTDLIQWIDLVTGTRFNYLGDPTNPTCKHFTIAENFLILANTTDAVNGSKPQRVWWSSVGSPSAFPTPGSDTANATQSSYNDLNDAVGGRIQGIFGKSQVTVMLEHSIWNMQYIGGSFVWQFDLADDRHGLYLPNCGVQVGGSIYFLDENGFFVLNGSQVSPIGEGKVDKYFWANCDLNYKSRFYASVDPSRKIVMWSYVSASGGLSTCDTALIYHIPTQRWARVSKTDQFTFFEAIADYTLEDLDAFGTIDSLPYSLDSSHWGTGQGILAGINSSNQVVYYNSTALNARVESSELELSPGLRSTIQGIRPIINGSPTVTVQVGTRNLQSGSVSYSTAANVNPVSGYHDFRQEGRFHRGRLNTVGDFTAIYGFDFKFKLGGIR